MIYKYMYMTIGSIVQYTRMNAIIYIYMYTCYIAAGIFLNIVLCILIMLFSSHSLLSQQLMIFGCSGFGDHGGAPCRPICSTCVPFQTTSFVIDCSTCEWPVHVIAPCRDVEHSTKGWR